jgi:hypothetical protein
MIAAKIIKKAIIVCLGFLNYRFFKTGLSQKRINLMKIKKMEAPMKTVAAAENHLNNLTNHCDHLLS